MGLTSRTDEPLVSVVIPTLNAGTGLPVLIESIRSQEVRGAVEILIIDSGSRDGTPRLARENGARVLSTGRARFNHGRTRNEAIQKSRGSYIALTVQDALPTDNLWLARLLAPLRERSDVAGSYGLQVAPPSAGLLARTRSDVWCRKNGSPVIKSLQTHQAFWEMRPSERLQLIRFDNVSSCIRRSAWETIPYPEYRYGEDMAWAKQVLFAGHSIAYVPRAQVWHCHERGWFYELRRAYMDGWTRVKLVDWPASTLDVRSVLAAWRRIGFFLLTKRFEPMVEPSAIRRFVKKEIKHHESLDHSELVEMYLEVLRFSLGLMETALNLCCDDKLPTGSWSDMLRFASVAIVGQYLGTGAAAELMQGFSLRRAPWFWLHQFLGRGI